MITQQLIIDIASQDGPFEYYIESDNTCISFDNPTGITDTNSITVIASSNDSTCFTTTTATMYVVDKNGCRSSIVLPLQDPCASFNLSDISQVGDYEFAVNALSPSCSDIEFTWSYNDSIFDLETSFEGNFISTIKLNPKQLSSFPDTSSLSVIATDCNQCSKQKNKVFTLCRPQVNTLSLVMTCVSVNDNPNDSQFLYLSPKFFLNAHNNCTTPINWNSVEFDLPTGMFVTAPDSDGFRNLVAGSDFVPGTYFGSWYVRNSEGVKSNVAAVNISVQECSSTKTIAIYDETIKIDLSETIGGETITIPIEDKIAVAEGAAIDWSTWQVTSTPDPYVNINDITLTTNSVTGKHEIQYVTPDPIITDAFGWTLADTNGVYANTAVYTLVASSNVPTANDDSDCSICGQSVTIDVLANDTAVDPLDASSVNIVTPPSNGTASVNSQGKIIYTPLSTYQGSDTIEYTVRDVYGSISNIATVTITVICAGEDTQVNVCSA